MCLRTCHFTFLLVPRLCNWERGYESEVHVNLRVSVLSLPASRPAHRCKVITPSAEKTRGLSSVDFVPEERGGFNWSATAELHRTIQYTMALSREQVEQYIAGVKKRITNEREVSS